MKRFAAVAHSMFWAAAGRVVWVTVGGGLTRWAARILAIPALLAAAVAGAHSASDAYLSLSADPAGKTDKTVVHGQWDIALRDLDFVLKLDDDGDGHVTWREVEHHQAAIERYAYAQLAFRGGPGNPCSIKPTRQLIDDHADGAYAALFFDVSCARATAALTMEYTLFFAIDPSHRGIFVLHAGDDTSSALLSPANAKIDLKLGSH